VGATQALHAPAFLIDQDWRIFPAQHLTHGCRETANLVGRTAIAAEQDEAPGLYLPEERDLVGRKFMSVTAKNDGAH
jgi:hypothetical protein